MKKRITYQLLLAQSQVAVLLLVLVQVQVMQQVVMAYGWVIKKDWLCDEGYWNRKQIGGI